VSLASARRPRLRIAFVYDALVPYCAGGAEQRFHELATRLAVRHDVHYVTWRYWGDDPILIRDSVTYHGVGGPRPFYGADGRRTVREQAAFAARLPAALARIGADVVDISATPFPPVYAAWLATRLTRTPLIATWHEYWGEHWASYLDDRPLTARLARSAEAGARGLADRRVAVSAFTARRLAGAGAAGAGAQAAGAQGAGAVATVVAGRQGADIDVVPNGVDVEALSAAGARPVTQRRIDVVFVGRLIAEKRVDLLIRAVASLAARRPGISCQIVGDGPEREALEALVRELGVGEQVTLTGRLAQEDVAARLGSARLLAMPSAREGYGISVVEGQAAGAVPLVARSPLSAASDLVRDGVDGLVVDGSAEAYARAIEHLLDDPGRLERLSAAARQTGATRGWDARAAEIERIYIDLVARRRPRGLRIPGTGRRPATGPWGAAS
jgi:glycosyltransferase involved in cell wall biosynthesis